MQSLLVAGVVQVQVHVSSSRKRAAPAAWPYLEIAMTNLVWCMAHKRWVGGGSYIAQKSCNSIANECAMQVWGVAMKG